jgi:hypothetical protein
MKKINSFLYSSGCVNICCLWFYFMTVNLTCGLYYKHRRIVNYASSVVTKLETLLTDDTRVVIYNRPVFVVQATDH